MADKYLGHDTLLEDVGLEEILDCILEDDVKEEEEEYDALNDETFGSEATIGDWELDHEKLAELTESSRPQNQDDTNQKDKSTTDIGDSLSHLVLDENQGIIPRPGVWDSPANLPLPKSQLPSPLTNALKNACTVEEIERSLITNRPPPGLTKPTQPQQRPQKADGSPFFDPLPLNDKLHINGLPAVPRFPPPSLGVIPPHPVLIHPNMRLPYPQFMQNARLLGNQGVNVIRYPLPPHLMIPPGAQRQPPHGVFGGNFPQPPHPGLGPHHQFLHPEQGMIPPFPRDQNNHQQHNFLHSNVQKQQNRSFYHNNQSGNHETFFKNNQYIHQNHNRNNQRQYQHSTQGMNGVNGVNGSGEYDEYAGLMSNREKQWLINIQLLQLNTNQSYVDDYYYTVFCDRQNKKNNDPARKYSKDKLYYNNNGFNKDSKDKEQPQLTKVVYTPLQFENSLGKLQCGSVTAPRKIIDMDVVSNNEPQSTNILQQKDTKKTRQLLLEIERLYSIQLKLEDLSNPLALLSEQQQVEGETTVVKKTAPELISSIFTSLMQLLQDDKFASMLGIRKGKMLLLRFLPRVDAKEYSEQLANLWIGILRGLSVIGRRDVHIMPNFYPEFRNWLETVTDFNVILRLAKALSDTVNQTSKKNNLLSALANEFGVSAIASMISQAEQLYPTDKSLTEEWSAFILAIDQRIDSPQSGVKMYDPLPKNTLEQHLKRISSLKSERYAVFASWFTT